MTIVFSILAQTELEETVLYYESEEEGLGEEFKNIVIDVINKLKTFPEAYMKISPNIRRIVLSKFTYNIFYNYNDDIIIIISIAHQHRKPFYTT